MPFWFFISAIVAMTLFNLAANGVWFWLAGRVFCGSRVTFWRGVGIAIAASVGLGMAVVLAAVLNPFVILLSFPGAIVLAVWMVRSGFGLSWARSVGVLITAFVCCGVVNIAVGLTMRRYWVEVFVVSSGSMAPTLPVNCRFVVDKTLSPERWDVIAFHPAHDRRETWVKRVIALPGELVEIRGRAVLIKGSEAGMPASMAGIEYHGDWRPSNGAATRGCGGTPFMLRQGEYFVVGDNTTESLDSRNWVEEYGDGVQVGAVPSTAIVGVARAIYSPWSGRRLFR